MQFHRTVSVVTVATVLAVTAVAYTATFLDKEVSFHESDKYGR